MEVKARLSSGTRPELNPKLRKRIRETFDLDAFPETPDRFSLVGGKLVTGKNWKLNGKTDAEQPRKLAQSKAIDPTPAPIVKTAAPPLILTIPPGWVVPPRSSTFYAVPVIIATSLLLALSIIGAVVGTVIWRKRKRRVKHVENGITIKPEKRKRRWYRKQSKNRAKGLLSEKGLEKESTSTDQQSIFSQSIPEPEDPRASTTALSDVTQSTSSITTRFSTRAHPLATHSNSNLSTVSTTSTLQRSPSPQSFTAPATPLEAELPVVLDSISSESSPVLPASDLESIFTTEEVTSPPAYASTFASGSTLLPSQRALEKRRESLTESTQIVEDAAVEEEVEELVERSTYSGHLATDDKDVLSRLHAHSVMNPFEESLTISASAPLRDETGEEEELEEEGWENFIEETKEEAEESEEEEEEEELEEGEIREGEVEEGIWYGDFPPPSKRIGYQNPFKERIGRRVESLLDLASAPSEGEGV